jgi:hypothetical protein
MITGTGFSRRGSLAGWRIGADDAESGKASGAVICVHLSHSLETIGVATCLRARLALPASELIQD